MAVVPADRLTDWTPGTFTGVIGGIDQYLPGGASERTNLLNVVSYGADPTGVGDSGTAIQTALNDAIALNNGTVVYLPAGTFRTTGGFVGGLTSSNFTIRGAGPGVTTIVYDNPTPSQRCFAFGNGSAFDYPPTDNTLLTGNTQGSTSITIADASPFSVGMIIRIQWLNQVDDTLIEAGAVPIIHDYGFQYVRNQTFRVTGVNTTTDTIDFFPPIYHDPAGLSALVFLSTFPLHGIGIESLTLTGSTSNPFSLIEFQDCFNCWVYDVDVKRANNYNIYLASCLNIEVRYCTISERTAGGTNGAGMLSNNGSGILLEDCIFFDLAPCVEWNFCTSGSVIAYCFIDGTCNINHGPHNSFNLYEGNITTFTQCDGYFGGSSQGTIHRNWYTGVGYSGGQTAILSLNRFTRDFSMAGNIFGNSGWPFGDNPYTLGYPNLGNSSFDGNAAPTLGDFWRDWKATGTLTTRTSDTSGTLTLDSPATITTGRFRSYADFGAGNVELLTVVASTPQVATFTIVGVLPAVSTVFDYHAGTEGYQELDDDVENSGIFKGNRIISTTANELIPGEDLGGDTLENSYYRTTRPSWFFSLDWPPIDPTVAATANYEATPAGYRYVNGQDPPSGGGGTVINIANVGNLIIG